MNEAQADARSLNQEQQEVIRMKAIYMVYQNELTQREVGKLLGVTREQVNRWCRKYDKQGRDALRARPRGRKVGEKRLLKPWQCAAIVRTISEQTPDQLKMPFVLWTRAAVRDYIDEVYGVHFTLNSMGNYLKRWGFTPQKPLTRAYEQSPMAVKKWREEIYPEIERQAKEQKAAIYWGDETKVTNEISCQRGYSPRGKTLVVKKTGKKLKINLISALTGRGDMRWMCYTSSMTQNKYILFLIRLIRSEKRKVFFIADNLSVHHGKKVKAWAKAHAKEIELYFIPSYSPELNPDEYLNRDLKKNVHQGRAPRTFEELKNNVVSFCRRLQKLPTRMMKYFNLNHLAYCAKGS